MKAVVGSDWKKEILRERLWVEQQCYWNVLITGVTIIARCLDKDTFDDKMGLGLKASKICCQNSSSWPKNSLLF